MKLTEVFDKWRRIAPTVLVSQADPATLVEVLRAGGVGMVLFNAVDVDTLFSDTFFVPTVMIDNTPGLQIKAWIAGNPNPVGRLVSAGLGTSPFYSPTMAYFSSRGENPTAGDIIKPTLKRACNGERA